MNDPLAALPRWASDLLLEARVARLGMIDGDGGPRVLPVTFALRDGALWTAIDSKPKRNAGAEPARIAHLRARPEVALTVDRYRDDWRQLAWVQVLGSADVVSIEGRDGVIAALADKYEQYVDDSPQGPLIRIAPRRALSWRYSEGL